MKTTFLAVAAIAVMSLAACGDGVYALTDAEQTTTELGARSYAERDGGTYTSCSGTDSDGDKYVTCSTKTAAGETVEILCGYTSRGCKLKK